MISILDAKRRLLAMPGVLRKGDAAANEGMNQAAVEQVALSREALDWFRQEYANTADERQQAYERSNAVSDEQLAAMRTQNRIAAGYEADRTNTFRPLEQRMVADAQAYDTPDRREAAAAEAGADVRMATGRQQDALSRSLMRSGVNPGSGAALAAREHGALASAAAEAGAETMARRRVEDMGWARMSDAASLGRGLPSQQVAAMQSGTAAGGAAAGTSMQGLHAATSGASMMGQGFQQAGNFMQGAGNLYGQMAQSQNASAGNDAAVWGTVGTVAGVAAMAF